MDGLCRGSRFLLGSSRRRLQRDNFRSGIGIFYTSINISGVSISFCRSRLLSCCNRRFLLRDRFPGPLRSSPGTDPARTLTAKASSSLKISSSSAGGISWAASGCVPHGFGEFDRRRVLLGDTGIRLPRGHGVVVGGVVIRLTTKDCITLRAFDLLLPIYESSAEPFTPQCGQCIFIANLPTGRLS